jgi:signal transduction histidine kinase
LGLAIVRHIAAAHGERVSVESALGKGTTFSLELRSTD